MRLPYLQVADEAWIRAKVLGGLLGISRREAMGLLIDLWAWAVDLGSPDDPPTGDIRSDRAEHILAAGLEWRSKTKRPSELATALYDCGVVEKTSFGLRVRGMDRYRRTWEKNRRRKPANKTPVTGTSRAGLAPEPARETETETETETEKKEEIVREPLGEKTEKFELAAVPAGPKPRELSTQERFLAWFQAQRSERTKSPDTKRSIARVNTDLAFVKDHPGGLMARAATLFLVDERKGQLAPPWPLWAFVQDWAQYLAVAKRESA